MVLDMSERITLIGLNVRHSELYGIAVQIEFVHTGNIGSKCLQFDVQPLVFENKPLLARKELQLAVAGTPPRGLTRAF